MHSLLIAAFLFVQGGTIEGKLARAGGVSAAGIRVAAMAISDRSLVSFAQTDNEGRFRIVDVPQGRYYLTAGPVTNPVFFPGVFSADDAIVLTVGPAARVQDVDFSVSGNGTIAGTLTRADGTPSAGARVTLMQASTRVTPLTTRAAIASVQTDASGHFRFSDVPPERYTISTGGPASRVFFPGVFGEEQAAVINVGSGTIIDNADFSLAANGVRIRGRVAGAANLPPDIQAALRVNAISLRQGAGALRLSWNVEPSGRFEIKGVAPGEYTISLSPGASGAAPKLVKVDRGDINDIELVAPRFVRGRVVIEDGSPLPAFPRVGVSTKLSSVQARADDATFFMAVEDGETIVNVWQLPVGYEVKELRYGAVDIKGKPMKFESSSPERILILLARSRGVKVSGRVTNIPSDGSLGTMTLALSSSTHPYLRGEARFQSNGSFMFENVPPGNWSLSLNGVNFTSSNAMNLSLANRDISNIEVPSRETLQVSGRVRFFDSQGVLLTQIPVGAAVVLRGEPFSVTPLTIRADGTVTGRVLEGEYSFFLSGEKASAMKPRGETTVIRLSRVSPTFELIVDVGN